MNQNCPCGSGKQFTKCCGRFLSQSKFAKTPEQLMRSRYTAYFLGDYGEYLYQTWYQAEKLGLSVASLSIKELNWQSLTILDKQQTGDHAEVEFKAVHLVSDSDVKTLHERSRFIRREGKWFYVDGVIY